jgi:hypothetical protein
MFYTIYKTTNRLNGKYYIGKHQTKVLNDEYMGSGKLLKRAIEKYGKENFTKEILHIFETEEEMNTKEKELVIVSEETYNLNEGGYGGFGYINSKGLNNGKRSPESEERRTKKISKILKEIYNTESGKLKMKEISTKGQQRLKELYPEGIWKGKKHSEETKKLIGSKNSINQQGSKNSQYGTCWVTNGKENKKIKREELDNYMKLGYNRGRIL